LKSLEGKVAIVTGSGQGVGEGIAMALSSYGVKVALLGRTFNKVEVVASNILKGGGTAIPIECDVKNLASIEEAIALVISEYKFHLERCSMLLMKLPKTAGNLAL